MKKLILLVCIVCTGFVANATVIINNTSPCPFYMAVLDPSGVGNIASYAVTPGGITTIPGNSPGVIVNSPANSSGQNDGGIFIAPGLIYPPVPGVPPSGSFLVVGCGMVNVMVTKIPGGIRVDIW